METEKNKTILIISDNQAVGKSLAKALKYTCSLETDSCNLSEAEKYKTQDYQLIEINPFGKQKFGNSIFYSDPIIDLKKLIEKLTKKKAGLEVKIGNLLGVPTSESKFIICEDKDSLKFYSAPISETFKFHKDIAKYNSIPKKNVLGGGKYVLEKKVLKFYDCSFDFGAVPDEIAERAAETIKEYISGKYAVKKVKTNMSRIYCSKKNAKYWKSKGFKVK